MKHSGPSRRSSRLRPRSSGTIPTSREAASLPAWIYRRNAAVLESGSSGIAARN